MTQQFDVYGQPLSGGQLYIIQAGTVSTPQDAFVDTALTIKQPYPMTLDAAGRVSQFFLDNSVNATVKIRLQDKHGVVQLASDAVLIIGPAGGSGSGTTVDPTTLISTGNMILRYGTGALTGYVRCNNLTIGSATSGATERANADCQALFQHLWTNDPNLPVSPGRGASASADWTANKTIVVPDMRGCVPAGMDDMGNAAANRLTVLTGIAGTTLGGFSGQQIQTIAQNQLPNVVPVFTGTAAVISSAFSINNVVTGNITAPGTAQSGGGTGVATGNSFSNTFAPTSSANYTPAGTVSSINGNVGQVAQTNLQPTKVMTFYLKL
jgi:hypothetical protein